MEQQLGPNHPGRSPTVAAGAAPGCSGKLSAPYRPAPLLMMLKLPFAKPSGVSGFKLDEPEAV